jgi:hypothetical protein
MRLRFMLPVDRWYGRVTFAEIRQVWAERREEWRRFGVHVDGVKVCDEFLADLDRVVSEGTEELLTLTGAARVTGFHSDSIGRAIRDGRLPNHGRRNAPRVRRGDLASLRGSGPVRRAALTNAPIVGIPAAQIARAVVTSSNGGRDG